MKLDIIHRHSEICVKENDDVQMWQNLMYSLVQQKQK